MSLTSVAIVIVTLGGLALNLQNRIDATESRLIARSQDLTAAAAPVLLNALVVDDLATTEQILRNLNLDRAWDKVALYGDDGRTVVLDVSPVHPMESDVPRWLRWLLPLDLKEHRVEISAAPVVYGILAVVPSPRSLEGELWREARSTVIITGLLLATQLVLINMILSRGLRPIRSLAASAARFGAGDLSVRMPETTLSEVAPMVRAFNAMATNLERDITERKRAEGEKAELERQLRQAQKMEAVGRLAGGIAHDFNNLLAVVMGRSDLVLHRLDPESPFYRHVKLIRETAVRAAGLTQQLLAFSRKQVLQPKVLDLNAALTGLQPMLLRLIGEDIEVDITLGSALWSIEVDPGQLDQVILNLAVNARDAMPQGGRLAVRTANVELDEAFVRRHPGARPGPHVRLVVRDTGVGMDAETQAHLFEPFFTTKGPGKGTGLGLATIYGIIKQSGGHIAVDSAPGGGATFIIHLPRVENVAVIPEAELPPEDSPRGSETILLVEDEEGVRALAHEILEANGYRVLPARHGAEALDVSEGHGSSIDLLLTDVVMPGIGGRELVERLSGRRPDMRVLYMSGYTADALGPHGVLEADTALLAKPFTPDILTRKVREVLDAAGALPARTAVRAPEHARSV